MGLSLVDLNNLAEDDDDVYLVLVRRDGSTWHEDGFRGARRLSSGAIGLSLEGFPPELDALAEELIDAYDASRSAGGQPFFVSPEYVDKLRWARQASRL